MALPHAQPLDTIDLRPLGESLAATPSTSLIKTSSLQLMRVVLRRGETFAEHRVPGEITVHCLEGEAALSTPTRDWRQSSENTPLACLVMATATICAKHSSAAIQASARCAGGRCGRSATIPSPM